MKIIDLFNFTKNRLEKVTDEAEQETLIILEDIYGLKKIDFVLNKNLEISSNLDSILENTLNKREQHIPLQYIFNEQYFRSYKFYVDERVLIPRPETELLVDKVIELSNTFEQKINIIDVGIGSGAICISLALEIDNAIIYGCDISNDALEVAKKNKKLFSLSDEKLILIQSDKLESFKDKKEFFDIIVSNPPYIPHDQYDNLEMYVKKYEPELALKGINYNGLGFYEYFLDKGINTLKSKGYLCCEFGYKQEQGIINLLEQCKEIESFEIIKDYSDIPRIFIARKK